MLQNRETIPVTVPVELTFTARWPIVSQQPLELGLRVCPVTAPDFVCVEVHGYIPRRKLEGRRRVCRSGTGAVTGGILADGAAGSAGGRGCQRDALHFQSRSQPPCVPRPLFAEPIIATSGALTKALTGA